MNIKYLITINFKIRTFIHTQIIKKFKNLFISLIAIFKNLFDENLQQTKQIPYNVPCTDNIRTLFLPNIEVQQP